MLPLVIKEIIFEYLDSIEEYSNLPKIRAIKRLIQKSDLHVLDTLGIVLQLTTHEINMLHYRLVIEEQYFFILDSEFKGELECWLV